MKKYWKVLVISVVIVVTIGAYYVQLAVATKNDISFTFDMKNGNENEIDNIAFNASYQSRDLSRFLHISTDGSIDRRGYSFIGNLIMPSYEPEIIQHYTKEYRSFMRGKERSPRSFSEDETRLVYATFPNVSGQVIKGNPLLLRIDVLDKETKESSTIEFNASAQESYSWVNVNDVSISNGKIKVLATSYGMDGSDGLHVYTVDGNDKVYEPIVKQLDADNTDLRIFEQVDKTQNDSYYVYQINKNRYNSGNGERKVISSKMYAYNKDTGEVEELAIPTDLQPFTDRGFLRGGTLYIPVYSAKGIELNSYNIDKKQWETPLYFNYPSATREDEEPFLQLLNDKIYFMNRVADRHVLYIGDLKTGETLYEGAIIREGEHNGDEDFSLYVHQVEMTN